MNMQTKSNSSNYSKVDIPRKAIPVSEVPTTKLAVVDTGQIEKRLIVFLCGLLCLIVGLLFSPDNAREIGVMSRSLNSDIELVRHTTFIEIQFIRIMLVILSFSLFILGLWWNRIMRSNFVAILSTETPHDRLKQEHAKISLLFVSISMLAGLGYLIMDSYILDPSVASFISREDGVIEQFTALLFLLCSLQAAVLLFRSHGLRQKIFPGVFFLGFFLCFGEEISWGQRILGWQTSEALLAVNVQGETNLHNMSGYFADHLFIAGTFLYGGILPFLANRSLIIRNLCYRIGLPVASLYLAVGFCLASLIHDWTIYRVIETGTLRAAELRELLSSVFYSLLMLETLLSNRDSVRLKVR